MTDKKVNENNEKDSSKEESTNTHQEAKTSETNQGKKQEAPRAKGKGLDLDKGPWYKEPWPWILIALPGSVVIASLVTMYIAFTHKDSLVTDDYYKEGKDIYLQMERDQRAALMNVRASVFVQTDGEGVLVVTSGNFDHNAKLRLVFFHPTMQDKDRTVELEQSKGNPNQYEGKLDHPLPYSVNWKVRLEDMDHVWRLEKRWITAEGNAISLDPNPKSLENKDLLERTKETMKGVSTKVPEEVGAEAEKVKEEAEKAANEADKKAEAVLEETGKDIGAAKAALVDKAEELKSGAEKDAREIGDKAKEAVAEVKEKAKELTGEKAPASDKIEPSPAKKSGAFNEVDNSEGAQSLPTKEAVVVPENGKSADDRNLKEKISDAAKSVKDTTVEAAGLVKDKTVEAAQKVKDGTSKAVDAVKKGTGDAADAVKDKADELKANIQEKRQEN